MKKGIIGLLVFVCAVLAILVSRPTSAQGPSSFTRDMFMPPPFHLIFGSGTATDSQLIQGAGGLTLLNQPFNFGTTRQCVSQVGQGCISFDGTHMYFSENGGATTAFGGAGGGGTITSVSGTANQITVTGTTALVLSIPSGFIAPNGAVATTQTIGDNTTKLATDAFVIANAAPGVNAAPNQNLIYASPFCGTQPNCYPVIDDGQLVWDASAGSGSSTITTASSDHPFVCPGGTFPCSSGGDVGKIAWTTNAAVNGYLSQTQSVVVCAQSTIATVNTAHSITLAAANDCSAGGSSLLFWGSDDTTNLATAWNAAVAACTTLQLPGGNSANFGPAMLLVQAAEFNTVNGGGANGQNSTCSLGSEGNRRGIGVYGFGIQLTYIIPSPTFNFSSCTFGFSGKACFFTAYDGMNLKDLMFFGTGNSAPSGASSNIVTEAIPISGVVGAPSTGNGSWTNVTFMGWGAANASGIPACLQLNGGTNQIYNVNEDGCGTVGWLATANNTTEGSTLIGGGGYDNYAATVQVASGATLFSVGQHYCCTGTLSSSLGSNIDVEGGNFFSTGDQIGLNAPSLNGILVNGGNVNIANSRIYMANHSGNNALLCSGACNVYSSTTTYISQGSPNSAALNLTQTTSNFFDGGGNSFICSSCFLNGSTGNVFGSASITGTLAAAANINLSSTATTGWGVSAGTGSGVSAVSGAARKIKFTVTAAGTPTANPTITETFATPFLQAPICTLSQVGGSGALPTSIINGTPTTTSSGAFTWTGTPAAASTYIFVLSCDNP